MPVKSTKSTQASDGRRKIAGQTISLHEDTRAPWAGLRALSSTEEVIAQAEASDTSLISLPEAVRDEPRCWPPKVAFRTVPGGNLLLRRGHSSDYGAKA